MARTAADVAAHFRARSVPYLLAVVGILVVFGIAASALNETPHSPVGLPDCGTAGQQVDASAEVWVKTEGVDYPRITTRLTVRMPADAAFARDLFASTTGSAYRDAMRCLTGYAQDEERSYEWRDRQPRVSHEGDLVTVVDEVYTDVPGLEDALRIGVAVVSPRSPRYWQLDVTSPAYLRDATWSRVVVDAPEDAVADPWPWPPRNATRENLGWQKVRTFGPDDHRLAHLFLRLSPNAAAVDQSNVFPWRMLARFSWWLPGLGLTVVAWWMLRRRAATAREGEDPRVARTAALAARCAVPVLVVVAFSVFQDVAVELFRRQDRVGWLGFNWLSTMCSSLVIAVVARRWGVPRTTCAAGVVTVAALLATALLTVGWDTGSVVTGDDATRLVFLNTTVAFVATFLLVGALTNVVAALLAGRDPGSPAPTTWILAAVAATLLVGERFAIAQFNLDRQRWAVGPFVAEQEYCCGSLEYYAEDFLEEIAFLLMVVLILATWRVLAVAGATFKSLSASTVLGLALLVYVLGPLGWDVWVRGWYIPTVPLAVLLLVAHLRRSRASSPVVRHLAHPGASDLDPATLEDLRRAALSWRFVRQAGRALDRSLARGQITSEEHAASTGALTSRAWAMRHLKSGLSLPPGRERVPLVLRLAHAVTPVDLLLSLGPRCTPIGNARFAMKVTALIAVPAMICWLYLTWTTIPLVTAEHGDSLILRIVADATWELVMWVSAGAVMGLLWHVLPSSRGPIKVLPLLLAYGLVKAIELIVPRLTGGVTNPLTVVSLALFVLVVMAASLVMDFASLRGPAERWWSRTKDSFLAAYGADDVSAQATFLLAQVAAVLAIVSFVSGNGEAPSYPSIDPFQFSR